ncbi:ring-cleaving dioxygenase [Alicyclobacillus macrosporangiidus]|uniref:Glyoxalase family protein n=1 Tax=Alicyclobacillus macrosporangiidus TaxID=392015 RepID=A0A1I7KH43_9BACL|nr:ring-cleaving dioxygenase [Alicyclobacillus macrosporangiidus]SFU96751.1 glyoxalase family protein [Alicyclobacillus macrosporangiidus]
MQLLGIHHLTAVSSRIRDNYRFYTQTLGLRLVKRSVNQDDVSAYHLFYSGDRRGIPGNDLTFFDWDLPRERRGTRSITRTFLRVNGREALDWWADWLKEKGVTHGGVTEWNGRPALVFEDPEGQRLALIDQTAGPVTGAGSEPPPPGETRLCSDETHTREATGAQADDHQPWERSPVPAAYQIRGQGPILISVPVLRRTDPLLTQVLGMRQVRQYRHPESPSHTVYVYEMGDSGAHAELHVAEQPDLPPVEPGAGGVHHVAFRTPDHLYDEWIERLTTFRVRNSGPVDRYWFRSLYLREPNGVLFEIATDGPGFAVDEDPDTLGEKVVLPPFLEPHREKIVANLKPLD